MICNYTKLQDPVLVGNLRELSFESWVLEGMKCLKVGVRDAVSRYAVRWASTNVDINDASVTSRVTSHDVIPVTPPTRGGRARVTLNDIDS